MVMVARWITDGDSGRFTAIAAAVMMLAMVAGCSSKQSGAGASTSGRSGRDWRERTGRQRLNSLNDWQKGTLGANGQGPLSDIHFDYNDYSVRAQDGEILKSNADWMGKNSADARPDRGPLR